MNYLSTRGKAPILNFTDAVMQGLAQDGGLYLPETYPHFSAEALRAMRDMPYARLAETLMRPFIGDCLSKAELRAMTEAAYKGFHHPAVCPLAQIDERQFILELFHGPTLAFKDIAMQFLARLMEHILSKSGKNATIIGATSGDTGGAAIEAFANNERADIFILFPENRISTFQQWQMTCNPAPNVHALAINGNFDDCQALVKSLFHDAEFKREFALSGVNSINWARILAQIVYYFAAAFRLGAPDREVTFSVPTGNFGDILAGFIAHKMGLPIKKLIIACNDNDILARTLETGIYEMRDLVHTTSPSMDIQISSNFERLLFETSGRDAALARAQAQELAEQGRFALTEQQRAEIAKLFCAARATQPEVEETIGRIWRTSAYLADPHTATALKAAADYAEQQNDEHEPIIILATAHPAKFPQTVERAAKKLPVPPAWAKELDAAQEKYMRLANDAAAVKAAITEHSRIGREKKNTAQA